MEENKNYSLKVLYTQKEIKSAIKKAAFKIFDEFFPLLKKEKNFRLIFLAILSGASRFRDNLSTEVGKLFAKEGYKGIIEEENISVSTYPKGTKFKKPKILLDTKRDIKGAYAILIDDIIDTGETLSFVIGHLKKKRPKSIKVFVLIDKIPHRRKKVKIDFAGFKLEKDVWVVGYGMDIDGKFRELPYIGYIALKKKNI